MKNVIKIAITGGPCAGKTRAINWIKEYFSAEGYDVLVIPETATELINGGIAPWTFDTVKTFQEYVLEMQLFKEREYEDAAKKLPAEKVLIVCDRGALDGRAYITNEEFEGMLDGFGITEEEILAGYDAVFHLVSAAKGEESHYSNRSNGARKESVEAAAALDDRTMKSWASHPQFKIIATTPSVDEKIAILEKEIKSFLNEIK